jgi:hypothetical protein
MLLLHLYIHGAWIAIVECNYRLLSRLGTTVSLLILLQSCGVILDLETQKEIIKNSKFFPTRNHISEDVISNYQNISNKQKFDDSEVFNEFGKIDQEKSNLLTDTAKILAGMNISDRSPLASLENSAIWSDHRRFLSNAWSELESQQLSKVREWQQTELAAINGSNATVFYPFSNSDFLHAYSLFPASKNFILIGSEPVGTIPNLVRLRPSKLEGELQEVRNYLYSILPFSFFRTDNIHNLHTQEALPALYVFMARTNNRIVNVEYVGIDRFGAIQNFQPGMVSGVKITFITQGDTDPHNLYYFSADLSNQELERNPELAKFIDNHEHIVTYIKEASYLMQFDSFSEIKNQILAHSSYLLQDDSGLPINAFDFDKWNLNFYGIYAQPENLFSDKYQPELWHFYTDNKNIKPLDFVVGHQFDVDHTNLMLAEIKNNKNTSVAELK